MEMDKRALMTPHQRFIYDRWKAMADDYRKLISVPGQKKTAAYRYLADKYGVCDYTIRKVVRPINKELGI